MNKFLIFKFFTMLCLLAFLAPVNGDDGDDPPPATGDAEKGAETDKETKTDDAGGSDGETKKAADENGGGENTEKKAAADGEKGEDGR